MDINCSLLNLNLITLAIARHTFFLKKDVKIRKDTFSSLAFLLLSKKNLFCKLQLFLQNTEILHFPGDFNNKYNNLQIPAEKCTLINISNRIGKFNRCFNPRCW